MSSKETAAVLEIGFAIVVSAFAGAVYWDSLSLPTSLREPLGSATLPQIVCATIVLFAAILVVRSVRALMSARRERRAGGIGTKPAAGDEAAPDHRRRHGLATIVFVLALVFVALFQTRAIPTYVLTPVMLFVAMAVLTGLRRSAILPAALVAIVVGTSVPLVFAHFFYVNLP